MMFKSALMKRLVIIMSFYAMVGLSAISNIQPVSDYMIHEAAAADNDNMVMNPDNFPMRGNPDALVTIIEFSDFQCPFCSRAESTIDELLKLYPDEIRVFFAQHPLAFHKEAEPASRAAYAAWKQDKYWAMHKALFENQKSLSDDFYLEQAQELGLDIDKFKRDKESDKAGDYIKKTMEAASTYNIKGTPSFLINGVLFVGAQPIDKFKEIIDSEYKRAKKLAKQKKLKGDKLYRELVKTAPKPADDDADDMVKNDGQRYYVKDGKSPILGDKNAPVTIVEYTDFQCPFCQRANDTLHTLMDNNPGKIRVIFKHYPLLFHNKAKLAHQASEAAKNQKKFWEYHDLLFANREALEREDLIRYAEELNLNMKKFIADMDSPKTAAIIEADIKSGTDSGVKGTPHFLFNGAALSGAQPLNRFQNMLDSELSLTKKYKKLKGTKLYEKIVKDNPAQEEETIDIEIGNSPILGKAKAPVKIFLFIDFQCPFSSKLRTSLDTIMEDPEYKNKVVIIYKSMPFGFHENAHKAAEAAMFAHRHGKFREMYNAMFDDQANLSIEDLKTKAAEIGLNPDELERELSNNTFEDAVDKDFEEAKKFEISGTPTMVINGELFVGAQPIGKIKEKIDKAYAASKKGKKKK